MLYEMDVELNVNDKKYTLRIEPRRTLADTLRDKCGMTGVNCGCEQGVCGSCTIIVDGDPIRSCLMFAVQAQGKKIRTVESLAIGTELHILQHSFIENHALQCGFCTSGFLMLATSTLERDPNISDDELLDILSANLCRCTGYQNIVRAVFAAFGRELAPRNEEHSG